MKTALFSFIFLLFSIQLMAEPFPPHRIYGKLLQQGKKISLDQGEKILIYQNGSSILEIPVVDHSGYFLFDLTREQISSGEMIQIGMKKGEDVHQLKELTISHGSVSRVDLVICPEGYAGAQCSECATDYQDNDQNGSCLPTCDIAEVACVNGTCSDESGEAICICETGYAGADCHHCSELYQDNDGDGVCTPGCYLQDYCNGNGSCDDEDGVRKCICNTGYTGDQCSECATNYQDNNQNGRCEEGCSLKEYCNTHGTCSDETGVITCSCSTGYTGDYCELCDTGYQDHDSNGICEESCSLKEQCNTRGTCSDETGTIVCSCNEGYSGDRCEQCDTGYQDHDGDGICTEACTDTFCNNGACSDQTGVIVCSCNKGYTGDRCLQCAVNYQDHDKDGICREACSLKEFCNGHGSCSDQTGEVVCECETGYAKPYCATCDTGYQDHDGDGVCTGSCTDNTQCGEHGTCQDQSGTISCKCDQGYTGEKCDQCAPHYEELNGVCALITSSTMYEDAEDKLILGWEIENDQVSDLVINEKDDKQGNGQIIKLFGQEKLFYLKTDGGKLWGNEKEFIAGFDVKNHFDVAFQLKTSEGEKWLHYSSLTNQNSSENHIYISVTRSTENWQKIRVNLELDYQKYCKDQAEENEQGCEVSSVELLSAKGDLAIDNVELYAYEDQDQDLIADEWEKAHGLNPEDKSDAGKDKDGDGLSNLDEYLWKTDLTKQDTDGDEVNDGKEVLIDGRNPLIKEKEEDSGCHYSKDTTGKGAFMLMFLLILLGFFRKGVKECSR